MKGSAGARFGVHDQHPAVAANERKPAEEADEHRIAVNPHVGGHRIDHRWPDRVGFGSGPNRDSLRQRPVAGSIRSRQFCDASVR